MPTAIPRAHHGSSESSTKRFGALLLALGVSRFLRPRQPDSPQVMEEKRLIRPSDSEPAKAHTGAAAERKKVEESDRGRAATKPSEIPAKGWKDILWRVYQEVSGDRVLSVAAGVTFYALLAIFPAIAAFVSRYGLVADATTSTNIWPSSQASFRPAQSRSGSPYRDARQPVSLDRRRS